MPGSHFIPFELTPNFAQILWQAAARAGSDAAIEESGSSLTYTEFATRAAEIAAGLQSRGVGPGERVGIFMERGGEAAAALFGVLAAGGVAIFMNETLRPRQLEHIIVDAGASLLLATPETLTRLPRAIDTTVPIVDPQLLKGAVLTEPVARVGKDVAQIIYTSGSTGLPKGVTWSHANLWAGMTAVTTFLDITSADRIASLLPFSFDYGLNQLLCAVGRGATLVIDRSPLAQDIAIALRQREVTVLAAVPPLWMQLLNSPAFTDEPLPSLRALTNTGGRIPTDAVRKLRRVQPHAHLFLMYGLTEAFRATYLSPDEVDRRPDSIGRAIPGSQIYVLREDLTECDPDEPGELVQRGPTVTLGYWGDPVATQRVFRSDPLRAAGTPDTERVVFSGDLVRRDADGFLYFLGRRDQMIKTMGYRVSPDEITNVLYASGQVAEAIVTTVDDPHRGSRIVAAVVLTCDGSIERVRQFASLELPRYMQPAEIHALRHLPRTSSGKYDPASLMPGAGE